MDKYSFDMEQENFFRRRTVSEPVEEDLAAAHITRDLRLMDCAEAALLLAKLYASGGTVPQNSEKAEDFFRRAAAAGNAEAQAWLEQYELEKRKALEKPKVFVGEELTLGKFPYIDGDGAGESREDITWIVLAAEKDRALLLSKYALTAMPYHSRWEDADWQSCSLRTWLNEEFYRNAFTEAEKAFLLNAEVSVEKVTEPDADPGKSAVDRIFLLSVPEAEKYLPEEQSRRCEATPYAVKKGAWVGFPKNYCHWWLRTPGYHARSSMIADTRGSLSSSFSVDGKNIAVRPALWLDLREYPL